MLQTKAVQPALLELLKRIMTDPFFGNFRLVGGTALALQMDHRITANLDFFEKRSCKKLNFKT